jgi:hypothetical protein
VNIKRFARIFPVNKAVHVYVWPGPLRDLPGYLKMRMATPSMRRVEFPLRDQLVLTPMELVTIVLPTNHRRNNSRTPGR